MNVCIIGHEKKCSIEIHCLLTYHNSGNREMQLCPKIIEKSPNNRGTIEARLVSKTNHDLVVCRGKTETLSEKSRKRNFEKWFVVVLHASKLIGHVTRENANATHCVKPCVECAENYEKNKNYLFQFFWDEIGQINLQTRIATRILGHTDGHQEKKKIIRKKKHATNEKHITSVNNKVWNMFQSMNWCCVLVLRIARAKCIYIYIAKRGISFYFFISLLLNFN